MSLKIPLQLCDASPKNIVDLTDLENHRVQSKGRITYLSHSYFFFFLLFFLHKNTLYAYSLEDLCSAVIGTEVKFPNFHPDSLWEKYIDRVTHRSTLLRCEAVSWRLVEWRVLVFLTGWPGGTLFSLGCVAFGLGAHPKLRKSVGVNGFIRGSQKSRESTLESTVLFGFTVQGKNFRPHSKTIHSLKSLIISLSLFRFEDVRYLAKVPGPSRDNVLVVNSDMATLINTKDLQTLWTLNVSRALR